MLTQVRGFISLKSAIDNRQQKIKIFTLRGFSDFQIFFFCCLEIRFARALSLPLIWGLWLFSLSLRFPLHFLEMRIRRNSELRAVAFLIRICDWLFLSKTKLWGSHCANTSKPEKPSNQKNYDHPLRKRWHPTYSREGGLAVDQGEEGVDVRLRHIHAIANVIIRAADATCRTHSVFINTSEPASLSWGRGKKGQVNFFHKIGGKIVQAFRKNFHSRICSVQMMLWPKSLTARRKSWRPIAPSGATEERATLHSLLKIEHLMFVCWANQTPPHCSPLAGSCLAQPFVREECIRNIYLMVPSNINDHLLCMSIKMSSNTK